MSLSEKTLELNITHEILREADRLHAIFHALLLLNGPFPTSMLPPTVPATAIGLSLHDENRKGWDVRIEFQDGSFGFRCIFTQFKLAKHRNYCRHSSSKFCGSRSQRKPHCVFGINNNSACDQHIILRGLSGSAGQSKAVYYALPRIPSAQSFRAWAGHLSDMTSWYTVTDVESLAVTAGVGIKKGISHEIRMDYSDGARELKSDPVDASTLRDVGPELIAEVMAIRAWRALEGWAPIARSSRIPLAEWTKAFEIYHAELLNHWGREVERAAFRISTVAPDELQSEFFNAAFFTANESGTRPGSLLEAIQLRRRRVREHISRRLDPLANSVRTGAWLDEQLPEPRALHTLDLSITDGWISVVPVQDNDPGSLDWDAVSVQVV
ncbi:MAG TPA: hypothetical protein VHG93_27870 [Longimicrobium sp.]|nr:hypothetical protein [Longimicrobium sp.]